MLPYHDHSKDRRSASGRALKSFDLSLGLEIARKLLPITGGYEILAKPGGSIPLPGNGQASFLRKK